MHELSIAISIVEMATEAAARHGATRVDAVHLKLGRFSGVVADALRFSYDLTCEDTSLAGSRLVIEDVPVIVFCSECQAERAVDSIQYFCCSVCGAPTGQILQGREIEITALEIP